MFLIACSVLKAGQWKTIFQQKIFFLYTMYIVLVSVSAFVGLDSFNSFFGNEVRIGGITLLFCSWTLLFASYLFFQKKDWLIAERIFITLGGISAFIAILEYVGFLPSLGPGYLRSSGLMGNPIFLAGYLIIPFVFSLRNLFAAKRKEQILFGCTSLLILLGIILTGTRSALLGLVVGGFVGGLIFFYQKKEYKKYVIAGLVVFGVLVCLFVLAQRMVPKGNIFYHYFHFGDASASSRLQFWQAGLQGFVNRPFFGVGYENFSYVAEAHYTPTLFNEEGYVDKPHNFYVEILACSGLIAFAIYCLFLFFIAKRIWNLEGVVYERSILMGGLSAYLIHLFFSPESVISFFAFSFFFAYVLHLEQVDCSGTVRYPIVWSIQNSIRVIFATGIFLLFFITFYYPITKYYLSIQQAAINQDALKRYELLDSTNRLMFVHDQNLLGRLFYENAKIYFTTGYDLELVNRYTKSAVHAYSILVQKYPKRGEYWYQRAGVGLLDALVSEKPIDKETKVAIEKSFELTPTRIEPYLVKATMLEMEDGIQDAIHLLEDVRLKISDSNKLNWTLAVLYGKNGQTNESVELKYEAIRRGLQPSGMEGYLEPIQYYSARKDFPKMIILYQRLLKNYPGEIQFYANLSATYAANGQIKEAIETANEYKRLKPEAAVETDLFIQSLQR